MAVPIIQSVGATSGAGTAGAGRDDLVAGERVDLTDEEIVNVGASYLWEFDEYPIGTTPVMVDATTSTPYFVVNPDPTLAGTYVVRCTVNGVESSKEFLAVCLPTTGSRIPALNEEEEYDGGGNAKGWHPALTKFMRETDQRLPQGGSTIVSRIEVAARYSHNSDTPLIVGAVTFDPTLYENDTMSVAYDFVVIAAVGTSPLTGHVALYDLDNDELVTSGDVVFANATTPIEYTASLTVGPGAGLLKNSSTLYEIRVYLDAPAVDPETDTIELYRAELRVTQTVTATGPET